MKPGTIGDSCTASEAIAADRATPPTGIEYKAQSAERTVRKLADENFKKSLSEAMAAENRALGKMLATATYVPKDARADWATKGYFGSSGAATTINKMLNDNRETIQDAMPRQFIGDDPAEVQAVIGQLRVLKEATRDLDAYTRDALADAATMLLGYAADQAKKYDEAERQQLAERMASAFANGAAFGESRAKNRAKEARRGRKH
jgi:hypothetical protein